jgi:PhnB protein
LLVAGTFNSGGFMAGNVKAIPEGYHSVTPYLIVKRAADAIEFYKKALGATELMRMPQSDGRIGHAELKIGDSHVMLADEFPEMNMRGPKSFGGSPVTMHLYVEDVDAVAKRAVAAGAKELVPVKDQFYGDRAGKFEDPFGHLWYISTHTEDLSPEEIAKRAKAAGF